MQHAEARSLLWVNMVPVQTEGIGEVKAKGMQCVGLSLALLAMAVALPVGAQEAFDAAQLAKRGVTFYAPFDGSVEPAYARGAPEPVYLDSVDFVEGKIGQAALTRKGREQELGKVKGRASGLIYSAAGNLYGERGTLAYWFQPLYDADDPTIRSGSNSTGPYLVNVSAVEDTYYHQFIRANIKGDAFYFWVVDREGKSHGPSYSEGIQTWKRGQWHHLVMTWDATQGMRFYDNGDLKYSTWGEDPFPPATPYKIAVGASGPRERPTWTSSADAVYDELVMLDRAVSDEEVALLMQGRYLDLPATAPVELSEQQLAERRRALLIEQDPNRMSFTATDGLIKVSLERLQPEDIQMRFILAPYLADGRFQPRVVFAQGGLTMERDVTIRLPEGQTANYMVIEGKPAEGTSFFLPAQKLTFETTEGEAARARLPDLGEIVLHVPAASALGEVQLFRRAPGWPRWAPDLRWKLTTLAEPGDLGGQADRLLNKLEAADRQLLVPGEGELAPITVLPTRHLYLAAPPMGEDVAVNRLHLRLPMKSAAERDVIRVTLPHAYEPTVFYFSADFGVEWDNAGEHVLELRLEGPGMIYPADRRLLVELVSSQGFELVGAPELSVEVEAPQAEGRAFATDYLRFINDEFTSRMSQNFKFYSRGIETDNPLTRALSRILKFDPDNEIANDMLHWARIEPWPEFDKPAEGPEGFPDAVKWARLAAMQARDVIHWWIDERQDETGYMVGRADMWNDDTKLFNEYSFLWLLSGDEKLAAAMEKYLDAHWASGRMVKGWSEPWTDIVHSAEEASYLEPTMALVRYGDPVHLERLMATAANIETWTGINGRGHRHFRSNFFTADKMKTEGHFGHDVGLCATAMTASMYLAWYSHHPQATKHLTEWMDAWVEDTMRETADKPAGLIPSWIDFETDELGPDRGVYPAEITMMMNAAYQLTGDEKYLQPLVGYLERRHARWPQYLNMAAADLRRDLGPGDYDELMLAAADERMQTIADDTFFQRGMYYTELPGVLGWLITGDMKYLEATALNAYRNNWRGRRMYTVIDAHKDRVYPWGRYLLPWMYCGGNALDGRGSAPWPTIAVSWEKAGYDFAALVHEAKRDSLRLTAYNFGEERVVVMRVWRLASGRYRVTVQPPNAEAMVKELHLCRGDPVLLGLPERAAAQVSLEMLNEGDWSPERPDLALSALEGAKVEEGKVTVIVHNVGSKDAPVCKAALYGAEKMIAEAEVPAIEAPLDFVPRRAEVTFDLPGDAAGNLRVVVDPTGEIAEIAEDNNHLALHL